MTESRKKSRLATIARLGRLFLLVAGVAGVAWLLAMLSGYFEPKVADTTTPAATQSLELRATVPVTLRRVPRYETAVGTIQPVHQSAVAAKLLARVNQVEVKAGQAVKQGELLIRLDDSELQARLQQVQAEVAAETAGLQQAEADFQRAERLLPTQAISRADFDRAVAARASAQARLQGAQQALTEAQVVVGYATIMAPFDGIVIEKQVDVGDTVSPGQTLLTLYDPQRMQLVAAVRESLALQLKVGQQLQASVESLDYECAATVSEIVPAANAQSRSFLVKVTGPCPPGIYSGMFGRLHLPLGIEELLTVPSQAIIRVGQLTLVDVAVSGRPQRRAVQCGRSVDTDIEILAGLQANEDVYLPAGVSTSATGGAT